MMVSTLSLRFFADFFLISAMLKLPIIPRSVASPISSRRENQSSSIVLSSTCSSRRGIGLGKIVFPDGQISDDLFFPFAHQKICSSETICPSRRFVRLLVTTFLETAVYEFDNLKFKFGNYDKKFNIMKSPNFRF